MDAWPAQCCINVADLERSIRFYEALGLTNTSRTDIEEALEGIVTCATGKGGKLQLAQQRHSDRPIRHGNAFWKLYVLTNDIEAIHRAAVDAGAAVESEPEALERWPVTVSFVRDPDGYLVEFVQQDPWPDGDATTFSWVGQYCIYVSDLDASIRFWETLGLTVASRTDIDHAREAVLDNPAKPLNRVQLAQRTQPVGPIDMGTAMWKLYVLTDDCHGLHDEVVGAGYESLAPPERLDRWPTTIAFVADPDGYQIELVQLHDVIDHRGKP